MTMRVKDVAPNEAPLTLLLKRLEDAYAGGERMTDDEIRTFIEMEPELPEKIKAVLRGYLAQRRPPDNLAGDLGRIASDDRP
jgi:hypothetical protein